MLTYAKLYNMAVVAFDQPGTSLRCCGTIYFLICKMKGVEGQMDSLCILATGIVSIIIEENRFGYISAQLMLIMPLNLLKSLYCH